MKHFKMPGQNSTWLLAYRSHYRAMQGGGAGISNRMRFSINRYGKSRFQAICILLGTVTWLAACEAADEWRANTELEFGAGESALLIADLNNDKHADIVVALEQRNEFVVALGDGKGNWGDRRFFAAGENPTSIAVADFNADGHPDIIIANHEKPHLSLALGDGKGAFKTQEAFVQVDVSPHPHIVAAADLNNDDLIDLVVDSRDKRGIAAIAGLENGRFEAPGTTFDVNGAPYLGFAIGDLNADGRPDLVTPNADAVAVMLNESAPGKINLSHSHSMPFPGPFAVGVGDFDGDEKQDLVVASEQQRIAIFSGDGKGRFSESPVAVFEAAVGAKQLMIGDFDGDSMSDVVVCSWNHDAIVISKHSDGFKARKIVLGNIDAPWGIATGDVDGDGRDDIVISDATSAAANLYLGSDFTD